MSKAEANEVVDKLLRVLDRERQAILDGRFEELADTALEKEACLSGLTSIEQEEILPEIENLKARMTENANLLAAVEKGFSVANARLSDIRNAIGQLKTYDGAGKVKSSSTTGPSVSLKA